MLRNGPFRYCGVVVIAEDRVLVLLEGQHQPDMVAVLRHMGEAAVAQLAGIGDGRSRRSACRRARPRRTSARRMPEIASISSDWPLPATPAMPTISPARTSKETSSTMVTPRESLTVRFLTDSLTAPGFGLALFDAQQHAAADHQLGQFLDGGLPGLARRHHRALPHHRDVVGDRHDLAQLVGDQHDGLALLLELLEDAEQMVGLGRRQHAGRLVEDQDLGAAIERLEDFDALLQADRQLLDDRVGIDLQPVFALEPLELRARLGDAASSAAPRPRRRG